MNLFDDPPQPEIIYTLRPYQEYAVDCVKTWIKYKPDVNGYVKAPGGAGKSVLIAKTAEYCFDMGKHVIALARSEKLLTQNRAKFAAAYQPHIGIYCAGIGEKTLNKPITIASIQSIHALGAQFKQDNLIVLIDEVQNLHPDDDGDTQYWNFLRDLGNPQVIGFTATDWRTASGSLSFGEKITDIPLSELIKGGFLIPPAIPKCPAGFDFESVKIIRGEYNSTQLEEIYLDPALLALSIDALLKYTRDRHSVVIFAQSRKHGRVLREAMIDNEMEAVYVDGETDKDELTTILEAFERREFKYLINVALLVEGWDCPAIDCIVLFIKTASRGKFEQILYRGTRPAPHLNKTDFLVIDTGGNFMEHGPLGMPHKAKTGKEAKKSMGRICPACEDFCKITDPSCPMCGFEFPPPEAAKVSHGSRVDTESNTVYEHMPLVEYIVKNVSYRDHLNKKKGTISLRIDYSCDGAKYGSISEWISPHSTSDWARNNAHKFFKQRGKDIYGEIEKYSMEDLLFFCQELKKPTKIRVDHNEQFPRIKEYIWDKLEPAEEVKSLDELLDDQIPF